MTSSSRTLTLSKVMKTLALRSNADLLFDSIEKSKQKQVIVDFSNIDFMSRSFAQQYIMRKKRSLKKIIEKNIPEDVGKMFALVKKPKAPTAFKAKEFEVIEVSA